jgi:hypothetical protein
MGTWARTGPVVVEVDGSAEGLRVVDYTVLEAMRSGAELVFAAPFHAHSSYSPMMPAYLPKPPSELADDGLRTAIAHVHQRYGYGLALTAVSKEGSRLKVLPRLARHAPPGGGPQPGPRPTTSGRCARQHLSECKVRLPSGRRADDLEGLRDRPEDRSRHRRYAVVDRGRRVRLPDSGGSRGGSDGGASPARATARPQRRGVLGQPAGCHGRRNPGRLD